MVAAVTVFSTHLHSLLPFKCESPGHSIILLTLRGVHFIGGFIEFFNFISVFGVILATKASPVCSCVFVLWEC